MKCSFDLGGCALFAAGLVAALAGDDAHGDHEHNGHQQAGQIARGEQLADGGARDQTVDDQVDAGRDDRRDAARGRGDRGGEALAVAALFHLGHEHLALHGGVRVGRAGAAAHEHGEKDVDLRETALHVAGQRVGKGHELFAHAGIVHQRTRHDEKRDGEEGERLRGRDELLHQQIRMRGRIDEGEERQRRRHEGVGNRDAREVQGEGDDDGEIDDKAGHASVASPLLRSAGSRMVRMRFIRE